MRDKKLSVLFAAVAAIFLLSAFSATADVTRTPKQPSQARTIDGMTVRPDGSLIYTKVAAIGDTTWIRVYDDPGSECAPGAVSDGGQGTRAPAYATWCWEGGDLGGGAMDTCSSTLDYTGGLPGCFTHYDVYAGLVNQWHLDTFEALSDPSADPDWTPWCGTFGDTLIWKNDYGYGPTYNYGLVLNLGKSGDASGFNAASGFTLGGIHMYDVEINYDYCYLEYSLSNDVNTAIWNEIARYGGTSFATPNCPDASGGGDYGCAGYGPFLETGPNSDNSTTDLLVRWRFASDSAWDDEDASSGVHTDGAWRVDNLFAHSVGAGFPYPQAGGTQNFEGGGGVLPAEWSAPSLPQAQTGGFWSGGVWVNGTPISVDWWHLEFDPTYVNKGVTCTYSNNWMWVADDPNHNQNIEDAYHFRLTTPVFECGPNNPYRTGPWTGVILEDDSYLCIKSIVGDKTDQQVRVYDRNNGVWGQWGGDSYVTVGGCQFWNVDARTDWSSQLNATTDSIQFSYELLDGCDYNAAGELPCMGTHRKATYIVDNVSVGVYEASTTQWVLGAASSFIDSYARDIDMHSSAKENWELYLTDTWEDEDSLQVEVRDFNGLKGNGVKLHWRLSTDCGSSWDKDSGREMGSKADLTESWNEKVLNFSAPDDAIGGPGTPAEFNGLYRTIVRISENSAYLDNAPLWPEGTVMEYFFTAEDSTNIIDTFPNRFSAPRTSMAYVTSNWDRRRDWPFEASILPCPVAKRPLGTGPGGNQQHSVLLVTGNQRTAYDVVADIDADFGGDPTDFPRLTTIWEESLDRLGIVYDRYDMVNDGIASGGPRRLRWHSRSHYRTADTTVQLGCMVLRPLQRSAHAFRFDAARTRELPRHWRHFLRGWGKPLDRR